MCCEKVRIGVAGASFWVVAVMAFSSILIAGCATDKGGSHINTGTRFVTQKELMIEGCRVSGLKLTQANGKTMAYMYRCDEGLIVCTHFSLAGLEKAKIAAATARGWKKYGLANDAEDKIVAVNKYAAAKGVRVGMLVREAVRLLSKR